MASIHPKLRRLIKSSLQSYHKVSTVAKAAQKAIERERVSSALTALSEERKEMLKVALPTTTRGELLRALQPGVTRKTTDSRHKNEKKNKLKEVKNKLKINLTKFVCRYPSPSIHGL